MSDKAHYNTLEHFVKPHFFNMSFHTIFNHINITTWTIFWGQYQKIVPLSVSLV